MLKNKTKKLNELVAIDKNDSPPETITKEKETEEKNTPTYTFNGLLSKTKQNQTEEPKTVELNFDFENKGVTPAAEKGKLKIFNGNTNFFKKYLDRLKRVSLKDKIFFTKNLSVMLKAGLSLGQAIEALAEQTPNQKFKSILKDVESQVKKGQSFANGLKMYPRTFPEIFIAMIESGEASGNLEDVLQQLHKQMSRDYDLKSKVKGAMIYPVIVVCAMVGIGIAMVIFVIPKFISIFEEVQAELPLPTKILIGFSKFVTNNGSFIAVVLIILIGALVKFLKTKQGKVFLHTLFLKLPILSSIVKKINLARFSRTLSSLLKTNIPIVEAFQISANVVGNLHYKQALNESAERIKKGERVAVCLANYKQLFSAVVIQMVAVGEESGSLDDILDELALFYEEEVDQTMKNLPTIIEPVLMLVLGAGVGSLAVAILMPMYSLSQSF